MNAPVLDYQLDAVKSCAFAELDEVRLLAAVTTDDGTVVPAGAEGTVVATWAEGVAFEVEFDQGLVTVEAASLTLASARVLPVWQVEPGRVVARFVTAYPQV